MDELIILLIKLIGKMLSPKPPPPRPGAARRPPVLPGAPRPPQRITAPVRQLQSQRPTQTSRSVVTSKAQPARRRRAQPPPMLAAPIITGSINEAPPPPAVQTKITKPTSVGQSGKAPAKLDAAAFRRWLTPATLRQQFMLTEIFQPPLALREPPERQ